LFMQYKHTQRGDVILAFAIGTLLLIGSGFLFFGQSTLDRNTSQAREDARPASVELTLLTPDDCARCLDIQNMVSVVMNLPVKLELQREFSESSEEGQALIDSFGITRLPTLIIQGEIGKDNVSSFFSGDEFVRDGAFVWEAPSPVYLDLETGALVGLVDLIYVRDASCTSCYDPSVHDRILASYGLNIGQTRDVDISSSDGRNLIEKYNLTDVPTVLLSKEVIVYDSFVGIWSQVGSIEPDGTFVLRQMDVVGLPYKDLTTGGIKNFDDSEN
jgi:hypothetical protein